MGTLYIGVATRIFRLFKCRKIMDQWYLTADYEVVCFESDWNAAAAVGYVCMFTFVVGIPLCQFLVLCRHRKYIDKETCVSNEDYRRHLEIKAMYGSIFEAYTPACYYYDLLDLVRRLVLTGGLILIGNVEAVAQIFLGIVISAMWVCLVLYAKPYVSWWDTMLSAVLSFTLLLVLVSGVSMRLYELTVDSSDLYQQNAFEGLLIAVIVLCIVLSLGSIVLSTKCLRRRISAYKEAKKMEKTKQSK